MSRLTTTTSLPRPRSFFAALLLLDVIAAFGMAFIEPQMVFYLYNTLSWTTAQYGLMMGGYGVATLVGQVALGQIGDHLGGKSIIALGFLFNSALSLGLILFHQFSLARPCSAARRIGERIHHHPARCLLSGHHHTAASLGRRRHTQIGGLVRCSCRSAPGRIHRTLAGPTGYLYRGRTDHACSSHSGIRRTEATRPGEGTRPRRCVGRRKQAGSSNHLDDAHHGRGRASHARLGSQIDCCNG